MPQDPLKTIEISNFRGSLTRILNGDLNSGFAKFSSSFGYDPFSKPMNLTWLYQPTDIKGSVITDAILAAKVWSFDSTGRYVYGIGSSAKLYKIDPTNSGASDTPLFDTPSVIGTVTTSILGRPVAFTYGAGIDFFNSKIYISSDNLITTTDFSGGSETIPASVIGNITSPLFHPMAQFAGKLYVGNGNNLAEIDATNTITTNAKLSPGLPSGMYIRDLDVSPDGTYLIMTASYLYPEQINLPAGGSDRGSPYAVDSYLFLWNGVDVGVTAYQSLASFPANSLSTFLDKRYLFNNDTFGAALYEGNTKLLTLPQNLAPMPNALAPNGSFLTWVAPEVTGTINSGTGGGDSTFTSLYYYGQLDQENQPGLWRMMRQAPTANNQVFRTPVNMMVNNYSFSRTFVAGFGKHYISVFEYNSGGASNTFHFYRFVLPPSADTSPILGVYETQTQLFARKRTIKQVRIYTEPTATSNGFQLDLIGSDGNVITNGTFTYSYTAGTNVTSLQGALERIDFNPAMKDVYALGIRITNTGTSNMTIKKIEVDSEPSGK